MATTRTKIADLSRGEPEIRMFMPPAGYTIVDEKDTFTIHNTGQ
jgi:hypothetical protein